MQSTETTRIKDDQFQSFTLEDILNRGYQSIIFPSNYDDDFGEWCENEKCRKFSIVTDSSSWPKALIFIDENTDDIEMWEIEYFYW